MRITRNVALVIATFALGAAPAVAVASGSGNSGSAPGHSKTTPTTSTPTTSPTKAYGRYCLAAGASKKHVAGQEGTPFSQCVTALAHAAKAPKSTPASDCKTESKKHISGQKGTPYSECVAAVAKLRGH